MKNDPLDFVQHRRCVAGLAWFCAAVAAILLPALPATAQNTAPKQTLNITAYTIDAEIRPGDHTLDATAQVTFTPLAELPSAIFDLHGALLVDKVTDASGKPLN
ncbi:MAG: hypothetical protein WCC27_01705, partial [Acidobacteriaceae bacterium]